MRWPWQPPAGTRRISQRRLIELQRAALRVSDLTQETRALRAHTRALELLNEREAWLGEAIADDLLSDLPLTAEGLHEAAFVALVESRVWEARECELRRLCQTKTTTHDPAAHDQAGRGEVRP